MVRRISRMVAIAGGVVFWAVPCSAQIGYVVFPQFANGGSNVGGAGMSSEILLVNPYSSDTAAYIEVYNDDGTRAKDLLDGLTVTIPAKGTKSISFSTRGPARAGWVNIVVGPGSDR